jgi:hypothetical protein
VPSPTPFRREHVRVPKSTKLASLAGSSASTITARSLTSSPGNSEKRWSVCRLVDRILRHVEKRLRRYLRSALRGCQGSHPK